jgi:hypothetical protein
MNSLKLYLNVFIDGKHNETIVYKDLSSVELGWKERASSEAIGIVHIGFIRPKIKLKELHPEYLGNILVSASVKWALPPAYESTITPVANLEINQQLTPAYLIINGFGLSLEESQYQSLLKTATTESTLQPKNNSEHTIVSAAQEVLTNIGKPLNKEEIFAHIMQDGLYDFGAKKPIEVLRVQLDRYTVGSSYSKSSDNPCFGKTAEDRFFCMSGTSVEMSGWLKVLQENAAHIASELVPYGIYDNVTFTNNISSLTPSLLKITDAYRYKILKETIDDRDPHKLLTIIPKEILTAPIKSLGFPVRVENVLNRENFETLEDAMPYEEDEMLQWANFGRKSINDFCIKILEVSDRLIDSIGDISTISIDAMEALIIDESDGEPDDALRLELIEKKPLIEHFEDALFRLGDKERRIIEQRTGASGPVLTLQTVADKVDLTRERVRQIQKKYVEKIIAEEFWDDCIAIKVGQALASRKDPLYLEMLELEDEWFKGFIGNYDHLAAIIELFSENEIRIITVNGSNIVTRIKQDTWDDSVSSIRKSLIDKAKEKQWSRADIEMLISTHLNDAGAPELTGLIYKEIDDALQFSGDGEDALLIAFGKSSESAVAAVLQQAESPLHYMEISVRATELLGKKVDERRAQGALQHQKAKIYGRGIYGLERFNPISERMCNNIRLVVSKMMYEGPLMRQWHSSGILTKLREQFPALPEELDTYILNIILDKEEKLNYLNRMVWARSDSNQVADNRIDMADAFTKFLEENGAPMKGTDLREQLREIRGVGEAQQIQPNDKMIQVGPDLWGLIERDTGASQEENDKALDILVAYLEDSQKGVHLSEVEDVMNSLGLDNFAEPYALLNLAQRDKRFHLAKAMFLGLSSWGGDVRRLNLTQAVKKVIDEMTEPMPLPKIQLLVETYTGLKHEGSITGLLINNSAIFDNSSKTWFK